MDASNEGEALEERMTQLAIRFVGFTARAEAEVRRRLAKAGCEPDMASAVIERLRSAGYLDDAKLAQDWVESRSRSRKYGRSRLRAELLRKGVSSEQARAALEQVEDEEERLAAFELASKRIGEEDLADPAVRRRLAGYLQRRGYDWPIIAEVLSRLESKTA